MKVLCLSPWKIFAGRHERSLLDAMKDLFLTGSVYPLYHWSSYSVWWSCNATPLFCNKALIGWVPNIADHRASALFNLMDWLGLDPADHRTGTMQEEVCQREIWLLLLSLPNFEYKRRVSRDQDNSDNCFIVFMVNWDFYDVIYGQNQGQWPANVQIICKHGDLMRLKNYREKTARNWIKRKLPSPKKNWSSVRRAGFLMKFWLGSNISIPCVKSEQGDFKLFYRCGWMTGERQGRERLLG